MDYEKTYNKLIAAARTQQIDGYYETHHIVPKSEGGSDDTTNLVKLTARQHYIAHLLLAKIYDDVKMYSALTYMQCRTPTHKDGRDFKFNSRLYEKMRIRLGSKISEMNKGKTPWNKGKKMGEEYCKKLSLAHKGIRCSQEAYDKMAKTMSSLVWITDGNDSRRIRKEDAIPPGWHRGIGSKLKVAVSEGCKGRIPWNKGKKTDDATKKKISESTKAAMQRPDVRERYLTGYKNRKDR